MFMVFSDVLSASLRLVAPARAGFLSEWGKLNLDSRGTAAGEGKILLAPSERGLPGALREAVGANRKVSGTPWALRGPQPDGRSTGVNWLIDNEVAMTPKKNVAIDADVFDRISEEARKQGVSPDDVANEAAKRYLALLRLGSLQRYGQRQAEGLGLTENDVLRLVEETRAESRSR